ncbi:rhodanese-like domain-containing protein [Aromatoleum evansii]|uniref:rhodanese-like domain-containing protein n=1 Tax=Aromatoleum evansii TaxID=59406 RepID=UPI00145C4CFF|nr:rhodanese-like domain-containing protein [Aromatoleum evansii]NMG32629.1 rhodanese-like domain-containing protein [Aromatoleum evansii]
MSMQEQPADFMEPRRLRELVRSGEQVAIVDVRSAEEFAAGHVEGAINIPADQIAAQANALPKDATIVTVCNLGGSRSCDAAERLRQLGYRDASPLRGGARGWLGGEPEVDNGDRRTPHP